MCAAVMASRSLLKPLKGPKLKKIGCLRILLSGFSNLPAKYLYSIYRIESNGYRIDTVLAGE